jgi:hypothetical protein
MATNEAEVKAAAQRIWPHAKRLDLAPGTARLASFGAPDAIGWRVTAIDANDQVIDQASADSLESLKAKLDSMTPKGWQAP